MVEQTFAREQEKVQDWQGVGSEAHRPPAMAGAD
jgi:hypothetical protein